MLFLGADEIRRLAPMPRLIEGLRAAFLSEDVIPPRSILDVPGGEGGRKLFVMPAFSAEGRAIVKLVTLFPGNKLFEVPTIQGVLVVFSEAGTPAALLDGGAVTRLRTAAASALASSYLSRPESANLVVIGTGALAPEMAAAHCSVRPIRKIWVHGRRPEAVYGTIAAIRALVPATVQVEVADNLEEVVAEADIVSCATSSQEPVFQGKWLRAGAFVDLVGSFLPSKREVDDEAVKRSRIFVDTFEGALSEAGDLIQPLERGVIRREQIEAELADLVSGRKPGRLSEAEITLFKSVGTAIEDLAAAQVIMEARSRELF